MAERVAGGQRDGTLALGAGVLNPAADLAEFAIHVENFSSGGKLRTYQVERAPGPDYDIG